MKHREQNQTGESKTVKGKMKTRTVSVLVIIAAVILLFYFTFTLFGLLHDIIANKQEIASKQSVFESLTEENDEYQHILDEDKSERLLHEARQEGYINPDEYEYVRG